MGVKLVCENRKARHDYELKDTLEAGLVLLGSEVKSLREGRGNLKDSYCRVKDGEAFLFGMHISPYPPALDNHEPERTRKLLLHGREISKLAGKLHEKGLTLIPLKIYFKDGRAKAELALAKGKRTHDRREDVKKREMRLEVERALKIQRGR
jgi:SsrA-binding protein